MEIRTYGELKRMHPAMENDQKEKTQENLKSAVCYTPLINDETTYQELVEILMNRTELEEAAKIEREERKWKEKDLHIQELLHQEYDGLNECKASSDKAVEAGETTRITNELTRSRKRPGAIQLRSSVLCIGRREFDEEGICEVFANGYAIYDNGDRKTVVWMPEESQYTYYFNPLRESEMQYQRDHDGISAEEWNLMPWHVVLMMRGEDQIERNLDHPKTQGSMSDFEVLEEWDKKKAYKWTCGAYFENPEEALLQNEYIRESLTLLSPKEKRSYVLNRVYGYTQKEIAELSGKRRSTIGTYISRACEKIEKWKSESFF